MTRVRSAVLSLVLVAAATAVLSAAVPARATHAIYVVQPVYFRAADQTDLQTVYKPKINSLMIETADWYAAAHVSAGDKILVNAAVGRSGPQTKSWYCHGVSPCYIDHVFTKTIDDLSNSSSSAYVGWDIRLVKNIITVVFFDAVGSGSAGLATSTGQVAPYDPEGKAGYAIFGSYVLDSGGLGTPGHDGTIAHEIGHTLRLPHNESNGQFFGACALMGSNSSSCWPSSTFLVDAQGSDNRWYLEKQAVHWNSFTSPVGAPSPITNLSWSSPSCGQLRFAWTPVTGDGVTQQVLIAAKRGTRLAGGYGSPAMRVDKIYYVETSYIYYLSPTASSQTISGVTPGVYYHWEVAAVNSSGFVHAWPSLSGAITFC